MGLLVAMVESEVQGRVRMMSWNFPRDTGNENDGAFVLAATFLCLIIASSTGSYLLESTLSTIVLFPHISRGLCSFWRVLIRRGPKEVPQMLPHPQPLLLTVAYCASRKVLSRLVFCEAFTKIDGFNT